MRRADWVCVNEHWKNTSMARRFGHGSMDLYNSVFVNIIAV